MNQSTRVNESINEWINERVTESINEWINQQELMNQ